jgi:hypothetical protein
LSKLSKSTISIEITNKADAILADITKTTSHIASMNQFIARDTGNQKMWLEKWGQNNQSPC